MEQLFEDAKRQLIAWSEVLSVEGTVAMLGNYPGGLLAARLGELARQMWTPRWLKTKTRARPQPEPAARQPKVYPSGGHTSIFRLIHPPIPDNKSQKVSNSS